MPAFQTTATDRVGPPLRRPPATRGRTTIADRVVAKIAAAAAGEVDHTTVPRSRFADSRPRATAIVDGSLTRISLDVVIEYPAPIRTVTRSVRDRVTDRVLALAGIHAKEVDITVVGLPVSPVHQVRVQ